MFEKAILEVDALAASLFATAAACEREKAKDEARERRAGRGPDFVGFGLGNMFGIAIFAQGFGIVGRRWNDRAGENRRWGGGADIF